MADDTPRDILGYSPQSDRIWRISGIFHGVMSVPRNIVMDVNYIMAIVVVQVLHNYSTIFDVFPPVCKLHTP